MANAKHEDAVMKMGFDYFRNTILKTLGIDYQYEEIGPTELVELTIQSLYMDFTFLTTGGSVGHFLRTVHTCYPFLFSAPAFALV